MIKTALSRKRTRAVYFFLSLSLNSLLRRRTIWWESGWRFPLSLSVRVRRWWLKTSLCHKSDNLGYQTTRALLWLLEFLSRRDQARERGENLCPGKKRERYKKIREARCYVLLSFARSFPTMMLKNVSVVSLLLYLMFKMIKSTLFTESESRANENRSNNEATAHRPC